MYSWPEGELKQTLDLGSTGLLPLEVNMTLTHGFKDFPTFTETDFFVFLFLFLFIIFIIITSSCKFILIPVCDFSHIIHLYTCMFNYSQIRFLHDPDKDTGFVGCALTSKMVRFFKQPDGSWGHEVRARIDLHFLSGKCFDCTNIYLI